ncbi:hypothetical protein GS937_01480 [Rhodococcus hoagii]|uniref:Uncharacterized protein n=1 Tax=Rhodococcus hoagii TaxID=43767 RepID=A0A9Q2SAM9_RHOHA|nr:hypothetical protein [Prescottella equi]MBM4567973.1 hypothetical protein [Prescottella equi]NKT69655.1 hypothetical protein [Prescottella equi]NKU73401.1 hypothetical protein [Prescottella equi]NKV26585.1 hypothetical protein [Prescottella equi]
MNVDCHNCGRVVADGLELCTLCADSLHRELLEIPGLVSDMTITRARLDRMSRGRVGGKSAETALPVRLDKFDQRPTQRPLDHLTLVIGTWARVAADQTGQFHELHVALDSPGLRQLVHNSRRGRLDRAAVSTEGAYDVELASIWLAHCGGDLRTVPESGVMYDEITDALAYVRRAVDRMPELSYRGQCSSLVSGGLCGAGLYVEDGESYVTCRACGAHHVVSALVRDALSAIENRLFTIAELERVLRELGEPIPAGTMRSWHSRGQLQPRAWRQADGTESEYWMRRSDPPLFYLGDVRQLRDGRDWRGGGA